MNVLSEDEPKRIQRMISSARRHNVAVFQEQKIITESYALIGPKANLNLPDGEPIRGQRQGFYGVRLDVWDGVFDR